MRSAALARAVANPWAHGDNRADAGHDSRSGAGVAHQLCLAGSFFAVHRLGVAMERGNAPRAPAPAVTGRRCAAPSVNGFLENVDGWESFKTVSSLTAYRSFVGEAEARTPTIRRLNPSPRHQLLAMRKADTTA